MARRLRFQRLDRVQRDRLMAGIKAGESITALAEAFGISRRTVYNYKALVEETELQYRSAVLTVRLNKPDLAGLDELAKKHGLSRAETARAVLTRAVDVFQAEPRETEALLDLTQQLHAVGGNLNQIARALNTAVMEGQVLDLEMAQLGAFQAEIAAWVEALGEAFDRALLDESCAPAALRRLAEVAIAADRPDDGLAVLVDSGGSREHRFLARRVAQVL